MYGRKCFREAGLFQSCPVDEELFFTGVVTDANAFSRFIAEVNAEFVVTRSRQVECQADLVQR